MIRDAMLVPLADVPETDESTFGGKAVQLGAAVRAALPVPAGFAIPWKAARLIAQAERFHEDTLERTIASLGGAVAVRSSAVGEDSARSSFAGVHATVLNVRTPRAVEDAIRTVVESGATDAARAYRSSRGLDPDAWVGVVVQQLLDAEVSGILFTRNPVTRADEIVVEGSWGLGEAVVGGLVTPDHFRVARDGAVLERVIADKDIATRLDDAAGTAQREVSAADRERPCLDDARLRELLALALRCEALAAGALDLEWCYASGRLYLLQQRPQTT